MKIVEICPFSGGACGVFTRAISESHEFTKQGHEVYMFSSNLEKGSSKVLPSSDKIGKVTITRFPHNTAWYDKALSSNVLYFNFEKEFKKIKPDLVITHLLHPHSFKALKLCRRYNIPIYLVTHAPFNVRRSPLLKLATNVYYTFKVKPFINTFTRIIAITHWELPYLAQLGVKKSKLTYIPNGLPQEFFTKPTTKKSKEVLFLGRIAPVKNLELLIEAAKQLPHVSFSIVGPAEPDYLATLKERAQGLTNVLFYPPVYDPPKKIKLIDQHTLFVLPSVREAMPQALLEAMARGLIIIASKTEGAKEIIKPFENGLLFTTTKDLVQHISLSLKGNKNMQRHAALSAKSYRWSELIKSYEVLFKNDFHNYNGL